MFLIGFLIFLCGVAVGAVSALIARRECMSVFDELNVSIDRVAADVATLKAANGGASAAIATAVAANQAMNDAAVLAAKAKLDAIDAAPPAPVPAPAPAPAA